MTLATVLEAIAEKYAEHEQIRGYVIKSTAATCICIFIPPAKGQISCIVAGDETGKASFGDMAYAIWESLSSGTSETIH